jgi:hypothetical protein
VQRCTVGICDSKFEVLQRCEDSPPYQTSTSQSEKGKSPTDISLQRRTTAIDTASTQDSTDDSSHGVDYALLGGILAVVVCLIACAMTIAIRCVWVKLDAKANNAALGRALYKAVQDQLKHGQSSATLNDVTSINNESAKVLGDGEQTQTTD